MSPYSASPCPAHARSPSPAHCLLLLCATSAYSKLYNECVTIKPVPVQAKFKCHCYFRATKICRPFASSGLVETEETDSEDPARLPGDTLYSTRRRICSCYTTTSCCSTICLASLPLLLSLSVSVRARLGSILGLGAAAAAPPLALNCRSCTDAAFIYGALNESHIYYTDTGLTMGTG